MTGTAAPARPVGEEGSSRQRWRRVRGSPGFRRLFAVRLVGQAGDGAFQVALASFVLFSPDRQATAGGAAAAFAVLLLPYSVVGPFAGVVLDRVSRQRVLVWANALRAVLAVGVAGLVAAEVTAWPFYVAALAVVGVNRFVLSALSASLPHVVPRDTLVLANSVTTTGGGIAVGVGGALGAGVRLLAGDDGPGAALVALVGVAAYLAASGVATGLAAGALGPDGVPAQPARQAARRVLVDVGRGARHVWERRPAAHALAAMTAHRFFYGISFVATLLLYRNYFSDPADTSAAVGGLVLVAGASTAGLLLGAVITPKAADRLGTVRWIVVLFAAAAVVEIALGAPYTEPAFLGAALLLAVVAQGSKICVDTLLQETVDDDYRGRVFAFYDIVFNVAFVGAAATGAVVLPDDGKSYAVLGAIAAGYALTSLAYGLVSRRAGRAVQHAGTVAPG